MEELIIRALFVIVPMTLGFVATIAVMKRDLKEIKKQLNGVGAKVGRIDEKYFDNKIEIERLKVKIENQP